MFATKNFPAGILLLISSLAAYTRQIGIEKIVFAGIGVSYKTITQLGYDVEILGPTEAAITREADRKRYGYWLQQFNPQTCIIDTTGASEIHHGVCQRFLRKAIPQGDLRASLTA